MQVTDQMASAKPKPLEPEHTKARPEWPYAQKSASQAATEAPGPYTRDRRLAQGVVLKNREKTGENPL
eukprot:7852606-Lingulodinium_polyedra.AAC.1